MIDSMIRTTLMYKRFRKTMPEPSLCPRRHSAKWMHRTTEDRIIMRATVKMTMLEEFMMTFSPMIAVKSSQGSGSEQVISNMLEPMTRETTRSASPKRAWVTA